MMRLSLRMLKIGTIDFKACAAGKGILDFEYYLRCLKEIGFAGPLIMHGLEEEDVRFSREFLERILQS